MAQYNVHRVTGGALVVDCQADQLQDLRSRFVIPLRSVDVRLVKNERLSPVFTVLGDRLMLVTPLARSISVQDIQATVASLAVHRYAIQGALDLLITGS